MNWFQKQDLSQHLPGLKRARLDTRELHFAIGGSAPAFSCGDQPGIGTGSVFRAATRAERQTGLFSSRMLAQCNLAMCHAIVGSVTSNSLRYLSFIVLFPSWSQKNRS